MLALMDAPAEEIGPPAQPTTVEEEWYEHPFPPYGYPHR
jgi:hypothetical protein